MDEVINKCLDSERIFNSNLEQRLDLGDSKSRISVKEVVILDPGLKPLAGVHHLIHLGLVSIDGDLDKVHHRFFLLGAFA